MKSKARFTTGEQLFGEWTTDVTTGSGPVVWPHGLPGFELTPGHVSILGGAPAGGKTAFTMMIVTEALRHTPTLRALVCNVEMAPAALLDRQLSRLSGIPADVVRLRRFTAEHHERLDAGLGTLESVIDRMAFLEPPFDMTNVAHSADKFDADLIICDYIQRFGSGGNDADPRLRTIAVMDRLRQFAACNVCVVALSAVGRSKDTKGRSSYGAGTLSLASFRDSGELEFGADNAYIIAPVRDNDPSTVRLEHLKCRHGAQTSITLKFDRPFQSFAPVADTGTAKPPKPKRPAKPDPVLIPENLTALWASVKPAGDDDDSEAAK